MYKQKSWQLLIICFILTVIALSSPVMRVWAANNNYRPNEVVVKLDLTTGVTIDEINATYGTTTIGPLLGSAGLYLLQTPSGQDAAVVAAQIALDVRVLYAEPNFIHEVPEANPSSIKAWGGEDPGPFTSQYAIDLLHLPQAHAINQGAGTVVAILDTGVQLDHPTLGTVLISGYDFVDDDSLADDEVGVPEDMSGHGTHVAGIIHLVAPKAQIMPLRILDKDGRGDIVTLAEAMRYAIDNGADVINLSLGMSNESNLLEEITKEATLNGLTVVAAAGNLNTKDKQYPAADDCALAITSVGSTSIKSAFANYGSWISGVAPGQGINSALPPNGYGSWSGTSMSTPFAAGQAALIHSVDPTLNARQVAQLIGGTALSLDALNPGFDGDLGAGQIDIGQSLQTLQAGNLPDDWKKLISGSCVSDAQGELTHSGLIETRPGSSDEGEWVVGGLTFTADASTEFRTDKGPLNVGVCAEVEYIVSDGQNMAEKIASKNAVDCSGPDTQSAHGLLEVIPAANLTGTWTIGGFTV